MARLTNVMDANTSEQTFPCFMQCRAGDTRWTETLDSRLIRRPGLEYFHFTGLGFLLY